MIIHNYCEFKCMLSIASVNHAHVEPSTKVMRSYYIKIISLSLIVDCNHVECIQWGINSLLIGALSSMYVISHLTEIIK